MERPDDFDEERAPQPEWKWWVEQVLKLVQIGIILYALHKGEKIVVNLASRWQPAAAAPAIASPAGALPAAPARAPAPVRAKPKAAKEPHPASMVPPATGWSEQEPSSEWN